jgi:hypothetical protein
MYLVLNHLSSFSFQIHPFTLDFYIKFGSHSFNCDVFGLKSFIELICLRVSSLNILFLYQIWSSFFLLLFVVVLILFFYWNCFFLFSSLMIWFCFIFVSDLVIFLFKSIFFNHFFFFFFKCIPNHFGWLGILYCYFFRFYFHVVLQPHDLYHKVLKVKPG